MTNSPDPAEISADLCENSGKIARRSRGQHRQVVEITEVDRQIPLSRGTEEFIGRTAEFFPLKRGVSGEIAENPKFVPVEDYRVANGSLS
jgi:hypothetical protein